MCKKSLLTLLFLMVVFVPVIPNSYALCDDPFIEGIVESIA
jgi:hypothetical protein